MSDLKLVIATKNPKKLAEMQGILAACGLPMVSIDEACPGGAEAEETGTTFQENAAIKALTYAAQSGGLCIADDSGLEVDHLQGAPGVYSARYAGEQGDDEANNALLLENLKGVPEEQRGAQFRCVICVASPGEVRFMAEGLVRGRILEAPSGAGGFGYDPLFFYPDFDCTFAEVPAEQKAGVSHRGKALAQLAKALPSLISIIQNQRNF